MSPHLVEILRAGAGLGISCALFGVALWVIWRR